uniref:Uncharacterized protein n=1 Tax=Rhizophora mucronata TaxID=61149 RepID=A0A2P2QPN1_RHIMU
MQKFTTNHIRMQLSCLCAWIDLEFMPLGYMVWVS